jgi:outer membrane protein OmpA-like peptidoglycan-associated protein
MTRSSWWVGCWLALGAPFGAGAQVPRGHGLHGAYYQGPNFEQYLTSRRDATLDFDWHGRPPLVGVPAEQFSARWTGWLVPPATGRYVLHLRVDDGSRLWLDERLLLDDWTSQGLHYYQLALELRAGVAYALRVEYRQQQGPAQLRLAWELPAAATKAPDKRPPAAAAASTGVSVLPARYLFSEQPVLPPVALPVPAEPDGQLLPAAPPAASTSIVVVPSRIASATRPRARSYLPVVASRHVGPTPDSSRAVAALAARLATGQPLTLRTLYFEQGQARLLPAVQASLDTLAQALGSRPGLRLQVQGHTDNQGDPSINQRLSLARATAVCAYLTAHGVAATRLQAVGYGGSRPVADNRQPAQRPRNRRVVLQPLGQ